MQSQKSPQTYQKIDTKELEYAETVFIRDIENRVFQSIVIHCLSKISGIALLEGNFIDAWFGRKGSDAAKGIHAEQDANKQTVKIKVELNICYGFPIPEKAEEIQTKISHEITRLTGLHVDSVHVVFKNVIAEEQENKCLSESCCAEIKESVEELNGSCKNF